LIDGYQKGKKKKGEKRVPPPTPRALKEKLKGENFFKVLLVG
jgi:hypothetical protein